jgi:hypothetical protein
MMTPDELRLRFLFCTLTEPETYGVPLADALDIYEATHPEVKQASQLPYADFIVMVDATIIKTGFPA